MDLRGNRSLTTSSAFCTDRETGRQDRTLGKVPWLRMGTSKGLERQARPLAIWSRCLMVPEFCCEERLLRLHLSGQWCWV